MGLLKKPSIIIWWSGGEEFYALDKNMKLKHVN